MKLEPGSSTFCYRTVEQYLLQHEINFKIKGGKDLLDGDIAICPVSSPVLLEV